MEANRKDYSMTKERLALGRSAEAIAREYLKKNGYKILEQNFSTSLGEIDIIARDGAKLVFVEVKSLKELSYGFPQDRVNKAKQNRIIKAALCYVKSRGMKDADCRFDVLAMTFSDDEKPHRIELIKDAFQSDGRYFY